jgi:hypothetical protein
MSRATTAPNSALDQTADVVQRQRRVERSPLISFAVRQ